MRLSNMKSSDANKVSTNVGRQLSAKEKEKALMEFVSKCPITIKYGCHTIELKKNKNRFNGFSFYEHDTESVEDGICIRMS